MRTHRRAVAGKLALLFDQHASMVLGLCRLLLRDHHEAEDAAQQTFVSAYRSLLRGTEPRDPAPWLAAIARNECRARIRRHMRSPLTLEAEIGEQFPDPSDIIDQTERRAELAALTAAIADLPSRQREAVALRDFLGLSYEEVASTLSVSVPVVESLLFRARRRLRDTVRTVPRYAAGLVAIPIALKATLSRDGDLDTAATIGVAGAAGTALAAVIAKVISLPFATKAATAVTVVTMATAGPQLGGRFGNEPAPEETPAVAAPQTPQAPAVADSGSPADVSATATAAQAPPAAADTGNGEQADPTPADTGGESNAEESPAPGASQKPDKTEPVEEAPAAEPETVREIVTTAEPPEAPPADPAEPETSDEPSPSEPLPVGPDGLPIIGLVPAADEAPDGTAPDSAGDPPFGALPIIGALPTGEAAPEAPGPEVPADEAGAAVTPTLAEKLDELTSKG